MNKKWLIVLVSTILSAILISGCNVDEQNPPPEEVEENMEDPIEDPDQDEVDENDADALEEEMEEPSEDPDNDGVDENDPNQGD